MPSSPFELFTFVGFFVPGLVYVIRSEGRQSQRKHSVARETAGMFVAGLVSNLATFLVYLIAVELPAKFSGPVPGFSLDFRELLEDHDSYFIENYSLVFFWAIVQLSASSIVASLLAAPPPLTTREEPSTKAISWLVKSARTYVKRRQGLITHTSEWERTLSDPDHQIDVGLILKDQSHVYGATYSFSTDPREHDERDIRLVGPIYYQPPSSKELAELDDVTFVIVPAREIKIIQAFYGPKITKPQVTPPAPGS